MLRPRIEIRPSVGFSAPEIMFKTVVFPEPLGPMTPII